MGTVILREYQNWARDAKGGNASGAVPEQPLISDIRKTAIKTVTTVAATPIDSPQLDPRTHLVEIESDVDVRYALHVRKENALIPVTATAQHGLVRANTPTFVDAYGGAIINFLE